MTELRISDYEDYLNETVKSEDPEQDASYHEACQEAQEDLQTQAYETQSYYLASGDR